MFLDLFKVCIGTYVQVHATFIFNHWLKLLLEGIQYFLYHFLLWTFWGLIYKVTPTPINFICTIWHGLYLLVGFFTRCIVHHLGLLVKISGDWSQSQGYPNFRAICYQGYLKVLEDVRHLIGLTEVFLFFS